MSVNFSKRFASYIIDIIIISCIMSVVSFVIPANSNIEKLNKEATTISQEYIDGKIKEEEYINKTAPLTYRIDKENFIKSVIGLVVAILYYVVFQFINKGQTLGKKLLGIRVVKQDDGELSINDMIFRSFIINELLYSLVALILLFTTKDVSYLYTITIMGFIQFVLMIVSSFMVLLRKDKLALQDIITKTKVIEVKQ